MTETNIVNISSRINKLISIIERKNNINVLQDLVNVEKETFDQLKNLTSIQLLIASIDSLNETEKEAFLNHILPDVQNLIQDFEKEIYE